MRQEDVILKARAKICYDVFKGFKNATINGGLNIRQRLECKTLISLMTY